MNVNGGHLGITGCVNRGVLAENAQLKNLLKWGHNEVLVI